MRFFRPIRYGLSLGLLLALPGGLPGAEPDPSPDPAPRQTLNLPPAPAPAAAPVSGQPTAEHLMDEFLLSQLPSAVTPTRAQLPPGQTPATAVIQHESHQIVSLAQSRATDNPATAVGRGKDDQLALVAQQDRDFFTTLDEKPEAWSELERNRRGQAINDAYADFITRYPADVNGLILYGKFLRRIGERGGAFKIFEQVNGLDPKIAVVKQQLANYLAEEGSYSLALGFIQEAIALAPDEPLYHYQLGELLNIYYNNFLTDKAYTVAAINRKIDAEFARATALDPQEPGYAWRHAECYYDMLDPDWNAALAAWDILNGRATSPVEQQVIRLHRARVFLELDRRDDARPLIEQPVLPALEATRAELAKRLAAPPAEKPSTHASPAETPSPETLSSPSILTLPPAPVLSSPTP